MKYSSVGSLVFSVDHEEESVDSVKVSDVRASILKRLDQLLRDGDLLQAIELDDTVNME
tara:strand:- start:203 stop:379 length:177 start_codon:yes stop_codon:yes gene_type:complete